METNWEQTCLLIVITHTEYPEYPEGLFSWDLLRKLSGEATIVTSEKKIRRKQQENKPSGTQGTYRID